MINFSLRNPQTNPHIMISADTDDSFVGSPPNFLVSSYSAMAWEAIERLRQTMINMIETKSAGILHVVTGPEGNTVKVLLTYAALDVLMLHENPELAFGSVRLMR